jgi:Heme oxygenase
MIRERIKTETAKHHEAVEAVGYSGQIMSGKLTLEEYKKLIITNLALNKAFEAQWNNLPFDVPNSLLLDQRRKTEALEKDATILGVSIPKRNSTSFPTSSYATFLGTLYVFEGSTLGGAIIYKHLKQNTNLKHIKDFILYLLW